MLLLKLTSPGVPDIYQGDELPFLALVDPDNRRPVDRNEVRRAVAMPPPGSKIELIRELLALRSRRPDVFAGDYEPLELGPHAIGYVRGGQVVVALALRGELPQLTLPGVWRDVVPGHGHRRVLER